MTDPFAEYVRNPDRRRLSRFIVAYTEPVTRLVRRLIPCPEASRVVQDVFLRLAESDLTLERIPYPRAYVLRVALNLAREHLRDEKTRRRHEREAARLKATVSRPAEEDFIAREAVERLYRSIDALPEPLRVAIHLRAVDGLSYKEIAVVTGVSVGIVGSRIQEARRKLRKLSGWRELAVAWANLELARKKGWFPAATDGLSRPALARLEKVARCGRTTIGQAGHVGAAIALLTRGADQGQTPPSYAHSQQLELPDAFGTPGAMKSITIRQIERTGESNIGSVFDDVRHGPAVPGADEPVTGTTRVTARGDLRTGFPPMGGRCPSP